VLVARFGFMRPPLNEGLLSLNVLGVSAGFFTGETPIPPAVR